jgi:hypothetical protein
MIEKFIITRNKMSPHHLFYPSLAQVEFRYAQRFENMPVVGACFSNTRGSGFLISFYENFKLLHFKIARQPGSNPPTGGGDGSTTESTQNKPPNTMTATDLAMLIG